MKIQIFPLAIAINFVCLLILSFAQGRVPEIPLDWTHKDSETVFTFHKVQRIRDSLKFEIEAHNMDSKVYKCFYVASTDKGVHIDDEFGGEYRRVATVAIQNSSDNKLAVNQRKYFTISIPAPRREVSSVNLHFGLYSRNIYTQNRHPMATTPVKSACKTVIATSLRR